ncbi:hypothetical protein [Legionella parisiensis]|uniref:Uncharacterized protein n=1 Tax=Legionella parisiensis TaxID=45071 RepID=A0A1E5JWP1_9GAMM|nr:hypothetical protein [Legionella parisiensis]KTD42273.1 hypothetical protein Lpar_3590 [Legionella parisiensis]OEH48946.1 hypothetical protein lpari_00091 [Legionella parisiensis]STX72341.1 Uncharacterised protein [Legionella parisiensis]
MKQALTGILTILLLPFTAAASVVIVALLLAMLALLSPVLVIGGALWSAGKLSEKFTNWLYHPKNMTSNDGNGPVITSLSMTGILFFLLIAPIAVGSAATAGIVSVLFIPAMSVTSAYKIADATINYLYTALGLNKEGFRIKHSYSILPRDSDELQQDSEDVLNFDPLFQPNTSTIDNVTKRKALKAEKEINSPSETEIRISSLSYSTSSDET